MTESINQAHTGRPSVPVFSAGPETRWPIPRADTAGPDAHSRCSDGFHPAGRWTGNFQADLPSGIAWAFNPGQTTVSQPEKVLKSGVGKQEYNRHLITD